ncbi:hypothetical protein OOK31_36930 [Streptomyces sp. NBC_00249]|uniref:hypothetical protein n=1 Tax=Streptomyces sp. NBC_00249 TaxID=2975690 RepID=UPI002256867E|nr:hypothetical protein [Streptomyces sp. NBC_00249]MCX5199398.1 hypothetical protein [Streptomyces sp. NBC_00249]
MLRTSPTRRLSAVLVATSVIAGAAGIGPAHAVERCKVSSRTIDNPTYNGPWPDNWDFTVKACVTESGAAVRHWATVSWDLPEASTGRGPVFNTTGTNIEVTAMIVGGGLAVTRRTDLAKRLNQAKDGSTTPASYSSRWPDRHRLFTDVILFLDWKDDGKGPQKIHFDASPSIPGSSR